MTGSLLAALLLIAQPAPEEPTEEPVAVEAEAEAEVQVQTPPAPVQPPAPAAPPAHANGNGAAAEPAVEAEAEATAAAEPEEPEICRRRLVASERIGQRHRVVTVCRTREEWARGRRR